nr:Chain C, VAL-LYS-LEU-GLN-ALA-VAL-PHE-ARG [Severe acute respiratory syndrome coronavirus 2]8GWJ_D Chain D, VAL-LYS-LEU-GLN-ALA-VAL-PHE-ARG [Severe acute respiratory syndrome coronavirus 2]
VKLQAVFR